MNREEAITKAKEMKKKGFKVEEITKALKRMGYPKVGKPLSLPSIYSMLATRKKPMKQIVERAVKQDEVTPSDEVTKIMSTEPTNNAISMIRDVSKLTGSSDKKLEIIDLLANL